MYILKYDLKKRATKQKDYIRCKKLSLIPLLFIIVIETNVIDVGQYKT
jgi:hypothetical protein